MRRLLLLVLVVSSGCAFPLTPQDYDHEGESDAIFRISSEECVEVQRTYRYKTGRGNEAFDRCMYEKGYRLKKGAWDGRPL